MKRVRWGRLMVLLVIVTVMVSLALPALAAEEKEKDKDKPERGLAFAPDYTGIILNKGDKVRMDLNIENIGRKGEVVDVEATSAPKGWTPVIKTYDFRVTGIYVAEGKTKTLTFNAEPDKDVGPGVYDFVLTAKTPDGWFTATRKISVSVEEKKAGEKKEELTVKTSYPVLRGPSDSKFEFTLDVKNEIDEEKTIAFSAKAPQYWEVNFKPPYEEKYFTSLKMKADESKSLAFVVQPFRYAQAGEYPITVTVDNGKTKAEVKITVDLTGTYKLDMGTPTGILSLSTAKGTPANVSVYVKNVGSATNHNITFMTFKPENWKVEFKPEKIDIMEPGDLKQVEVTITPAPEALVGDYSVMLSAKGEKSDKDIELRTTVRASAAWGWVGIGIIALVIVGLGVLFSRLGRR